MAQLVSVGGEDKGQVTSQVHVFAVAVHGIVLITRVHHAEKYRLLRQLIIHMPARQPQEQFTVYLLFGEEVVLILTTTDI